ncbi:MAG: META and DUF4377 domain-containing protein [Halopseudomonas yangmingensis]
MSSTPRLTLLLLGSALLVACNAASTPTASSPEPQLQGWHWQLQQALQADGSPIADLSGVPEQPLQLNFEEQRLGITGSCNLIGGDYRIEQQRLQVGQLMQTMMYCDNQALMQRESAIRDYLGQSLQLQLQENGEQRQLQLTNAAGQRLLLQGTPSAETRYGSTPEIVFLEVSQDLKDCQHPLMPEHRCLKVRDLHYDEQGLQRNAGEWRLMYESIEGFEHQAGIRTVLRLKRFTRAQPPADASRFAWVLDMVVESEMMIR